MRKILIVLSVIYGGLCGVAIACESNEIDVLGDGSQCEAAKFTITTTELTADTTFAFYMSASGTFYVDWGDGTVDTITRNDTTETLYDHTYTTDGVKTIRFGGLATGYNTDSYVASIRFYGGTPNLIVSVSGDISIMFPYITDNSQDGAQPRFYRLFRGAQRLRSIPETLFSSYTTTSTNMFKQAFMQCSIVSISEDLFSGITTGADNLFESTFESCGLLKIIPTGLFSGITSGAQGMFKWTFYGCNSLTSIPEGLFSNIQTGADAMFGGTFQNCRGVKGYIPQSLFAGLIANGSPYLSGLMQNIFTSCDKLIKTCPTGTSQYITGYEEYWDGHVACTPHTHDCDSGTYFPTIIDGCVACPENNYCPGGEYTYNGVDQGIIACPVGLYAPMGMSSLTQCGRILHIGDNIVYLHSTKKTTPALHVDIDQDGTADFFGNMTTLDVPMTRGTERKLKLQYDGVTYSVYDDSVDLSEYTN
jgi:hypothetical protein